MSETSYSIPDAPARIGLAVLALPAYFIAMSALRVGNAPGLTWIRSPFVVLGALGVAFAINVLSVVSLRFVRQPLSARQIAPELQISVAMQPWNIAAVCLAIALFGALLAPPFFRSFAALGLRLHTEGDVMAFMPEFAPIVVLMFLGTCGALALSGIAALYGLLRRKPVLWKWAIACGLVLFAGYATVLLAISLASSERVLARGQKKYFCEIDCHIAYSVEEVSTPSTLGPEQGPGLQTPEQGPELQSPELHRKAAAGKFVVVRVKTWFDEKTISAHRGNGPLTPNPRRVVLVDDRGRAFEALPESQNPVERMNEPATNKPALTAPLRPGEFYFNDLVFDVPVDAHAPRLLITDQDPVTRALIGHESSPLHKKIWFDLGSQI